VLCFVTAFCFSSPSAASCESGVLEVATVCFVGDVIFGACAHLVGNAIICGAFLTICESAIWCERGE
jgi:hypothetical protein